MISVNVVRFSIVTVAHSYTIFTKHTKLMLSLMIFILTGINNYMLTLN